VKSGGPTKDGFSTSGGGNDCLLFIKYPHLTWFREKSDIEIYFCFFNLFTLEKSIFPNDQNRFFYVDLRPICSEVAHSHVLMSSACKNKNPKKIKNQKSRNPNPRSRHHRHPQRGRRCSNPLPPSSSWSAHWDPREREEGGTESAVPVATAALHRCHHHARGLVGSTIAVAFPTHHRQICLP
jgi:hypothetical protein